MNDISSCTARTQSSRPTIALCAAEAVVDDVTRYIGKQKVYDDLTLVVLKQK